MPRFVQWMDGAPTRFEIILIALVLAMICGLAAESAAKAYARDLVRNLSRQWEDRAWRR